MMKRRNAAILPAKHRRYVPGRMALALILLVAWCRFTSAQNHPQDHPSWGGLAAGKHAVGFQTIRAYDSTRRYQPRAGMAHRPLLIHVWYPARAATGKRQLYQDLVALETRRENGTVSAADAAQYCHQTMNGYVSYGKKLMGGLNATPDEVLRSPTASLADAVPARGTFPLLVYAPSFGKSSIQNHIACEYFASHGYVVASVASAGDTAQAMTSDEKGVMAQVQDLEFLVRFMQKRNPAGFAGIGTFGFSWGGFASVIHQMRNEYVKAVASWDGSIEYQGYEIAQRIPGFDPRRMQAAYICFSNKDEAMTEFPFYKSVPSTRKALYRLNQLEHAEFVAYWTFFAHTRPDASGYDTRSYQTLCAYTLHFFDNALKGGNKSPAPPRNAHPGLITELRVD